MSTTIDQDFSIVWERTIQPGKAGLPSEAARYFLDLRFAEADLGRMNTLGAKAREGSLTADEQSELNSYMNLGWFLDLMKSKARISLGIGPELG